MLKKELGKSITMLEMLIGLVFLLLPCLMIIRYLVNQFWIRQFLKKFNIERLPPKTIIARKKRAIKNYFILNFPCWLYANNNGTADKRRKNNHIVQPRSLLYIDKYEIACQNPMILYSLIQLLRQKGIEIEKCKEEQVKYENLKYENSRTFIIGDIENIVNRFREHPTDFEEYCAKIFRNMGYNVTVTPAVNDGGYDLILDNGSGNYVVECKCFSSENKVGRPLIQKLVGANQEANASGMIFITTSDYTKTAVEYANITGVELINGEQLIELSTSYLSLPTNDCNITDAQWWLTKEDILSKYPNDITH